MISIDIQCIQRSNKVQATPLNVNDNSLAMLSPIGNGKDNTYTSGWPQKKVTNQK